METIIVLKIGDQLHVDFNGKELHTATEVADALGEALAHTPDAIVSIEADSSPHYEAIGKAIYGAHRTGLAGDRLRILVDGKPLRA